MSILAKRRGTHKTMLGGVTSSPFTNDQPGGSSSGTAPLRIDRYFMNFKADTRWPPSVRVLYGTGKRLAADVLVEARRWGRGLMGAWPDGGGHSRSEYWMERVAESPRPNMVMGVRRTS